MAETRSNSRGEARKRVRAAKACQRCNRKRVKCDVMGSPDGEPCSRCRRNGITDCVLIETKRGRYSREAMKTRIIGETEDQETVLPPQSGPTSTPFKSVHANDSPQNAAVEKYCEPGANDCVSSNGVPTNSLSPDDTSGSSYREISWSAMFNHFLDSRQKSTRGEIDKCSITYLGESFPLALVLEDLQDGGKTRLHHPGPPLECNAESTSERAHPSHLLEEDMICLRRKKAFDYPARATYDSFMTTFLDVFFPLYPIVNREEFVAQYTKEQLPWLLVQSCCFIGATFCPISVLHKAGFAGRRQARFTFYRKAKALFDTGYESNKIVILQSVIMMSFWGGGPNSFWNFTSWISTGVTLAETLGIHRSMTGANMKAKDLSLLKRLWWTLMIRDAFCSCLVGRPFRINTDMGDADMLTPEDFEHDRSSLDDSHPLKNYYGLYQIHLARLSLVLHQIVMTRWLPGRMKDPLPLLRESLAQWRREVPASLDWELQQSAGNMLSLCLSILFDHHNILSHLGLSDDNSISNSTIGAQEVSQLAAQRISTLASSIVVRSQPLLVPHEVFQGIFVAGVASYEQMRSPQPVISQLGRSIVANCQMVLHNVCDAWDPSPWVMNLFERLASRPQKTQVSTEGEQSASNVETDSGIDLIDFTFGNGLDYAMGSPWSSNPMLSTLFDFPTDVGGFDYQDGQMIDFMSG